MVLDFLLSNVWLKVGCSVICNVGLFCEHCLLAFVEETTGVSLILCLTLHQYIQKNPRLFLVKNIASPVSI